MVYVIQFKIDCPLLQLTLLLVLFSNWILVNMRYFQRFFPKENICSECLVKALRPYQEHILEVDQSNKVG